MNRFPIENIDKVRNAILADSASSASKLSSSKNISLSGDVSGSVSFDGSSDSSITTTIKDDSHNHVISNIDNLQSTIDTINTALASKGIKLSVNGKIVSLLDSNDNVLSSITTQDTNTTYNVATTSANGLMASTDKTNLNSAIKSITRSGTTFTFTRVDGTTGTFTQQDNNTTYTAGTGISISSNKITNTGVTSVNGSTGAVTVSSVSTATTATKATTCPNVAVAWNGDGYGCSGGSRDGVRWTLPSGGTWRYCIYNSESIPKGGTTSGGSRLDHAGHNEWGIAIRIS